MMDDKFKPINLDSPFGQLMEKFKNVDFSKATPTYPMNKINGSVETADSMIKLVG